MADHFSDMGTARQVWEGVGGAVVSGAICGVLATTTPWAYLVALVVTVVGGLGAGAQHRTMRGAAIRGAVAGVLWAVAMIAAIEISGRDALAMIPQPLWTLVAYALVVTVLVTVAVWKLTARRRGAVAGAPAHKVA